MTWIHCSIQDGSCVALTRDENFAGAGISESMKKLFFHVRVDRPLEELLSLLQPVEDRSGNIVSKYRGQVDIDRVIAADKRAAIRDRNTAVEPIAGEISRSAITERV
jgi:hypothetical protein